MNTEIPEPIRAANVNEWSDQVDVVVVGLGIAGGCAAVEAASKGGRVLVLERAAVAGGTSAMAGGHFYLGGGTAVQEATGHPDTAEEMEKYLTAVSMEPEPEKIRAYCADSVEHFDWLEALGFEFERSFYPDKAVIQPETQGLMYTGNEQVWPFDELAVPAPRGHKVPVPGDTGGASLVVDLVVKRLESVGVEVRFQAGARRLVCDEDGRVVGVEWKSLESSGFIRAESVVIAAGGFVMNPEMVREHVPRLAEKPYTLGSTYDDGLGIRLGLGAGAQAKHMDQCFVTAPVYPPVEHLTGIIVNVNGERFVDEGSYHSRTSEFVMEQPDSKAFLIVDEAHLQQTDFALVPFIDGWETVAEMEQALGIVEGNLQRTLDRYNDFASRGEDPDLHKKAKYLAPQHSGPWAAFDLSLGKASYAGFTLGGLATSVDGEVLRPDGSPIAGLYAAGACAANLAQDGKGYASGTQLGEGSYFGRRAGRHAAEKAKAG
ncbi:FAD-binding protein [Rhodococcus qingshengii]|uniref:FAD-binding protein n=1 Tax=Rhodococcus qingshengii TaxID=334542 RepID=UPI001BE5F4BD|nr:FAD-binding protein [Rhodococcus qingshengii]MBT2274650.1 FAD-binding protein [Rhodococcus qingshengii]